MIRLIHGDALEVLSGLDADSVDAVVTDPPYGLSAPPDVAAVLRHWLAGETYEHGGSGFMGKGWDSFVPGPLVWSQVARVLKPGGHAVVFAGSRTVDLMGIACRLGGLAVRDCGVWCTWQGFPKSTDIGKEIDRLHGAEREVVGARPTSRGRGAVMTGSSCGLNAQTIEYTAPATEDAKRWDGWGTGLKPAAEYWLLLRKPLSESSIARNVLRWGVGGLHLGACRFKPGDPMWPGPDGEVDAVWRGSGERGTYGAFGRDAADVPISLHALGRFPANLLYCPKASRAEREAGCIEAGIEPIAGYDAVGRAEGSAGVDNPRAGAGRTSEGVRNHHPCVKPLKIMRWLVRLVTPPGGLVVDPFCGSGSTLVAAAAEGMGGIGVDLSMEYLRIARARVAWASSGRVDAPDGAGPTTDPRQGVLFG